jgi:hypothetical protein
MPFVKTALRHQGTGLVNRVCDHMPKFAAHCLTPLRFIG